MTFVGSGSGYIDTWYDQSGNGRNATQSTAAYQPRIVNAGVLDMQNGKPAIYFPLGSYMATASFSGFPSAHQVIALAKVNADYSPNKNALVTKTNSNKAAPFDFYTTLNWTGDGTGYASQTLGTMYDASQPLSVWSYDAGTASMHTFFNGYVTASTTTTYTHADSGGPLHFGTRADGATKLDGYISEVITYASQLSTTNRQWLEQNILQYYAPPLPAAFVTKWYDQSGNGYDAVQTSPVLQPTLVMPMYGIANNRPTINFNGNQALYTTGGMPTSADYSKVAVFSYFDSTQSNNIISDGSGSNIHAFYVRANSSSLRLYHTGDFASASATYATTTNTNYAAAATYVQSSKTGTVYVFNQSAGSGTTTTSNTSSAIQLGCHNTLGNGHYGTISEAMVFSRVLSTADRNAIYTAERGYYGAQ